MNPLMGLTCTRDHSQGSYLLLTKDPILKIEDLVPVEMNMLQNYPIPGLLPIEFEQLDQSITLRYNVAVRRPLSLWSRTDAFEEKAFLKVLHAVCRQLEDSKIYMLNEQRYVMDPDYIFIGKDADDLALLYLPLKENPSPLTLHHKLICLAEKLLSPLNGRTLAAKAWLDSLRNDPFNLQGCKRSLNEALAGLQTGETQTEGRKDFFRSASMNASSPPLNLPYPSNLHERNGRDFPRSRSRGKSRQPISWARLWRLRCRRSCGECMGPPLLPDCLRPPSALPLPRPGAPMSSGRKAESSCRFVSRTGLSRMNPSSCR
ncbi:DUF6382 domain-containing protein [Paenibacillus sp. CC-CFT747]|nr:DUF6382 domain-containing protein [Paenibacillus sp. CC-CFT747]